MLKSSNSQRLKRLMDSGRTVFTLLELRMFWRANALNAKIAAVRMTDKGLLLRLADGYYALNERYNRYEFANRLLSPSYVSFHAVLFFAGVNFQARGEIGSVARRVSRRKIQDTLYSYCAMKEDLFFNRDGLVIRDGVFMADPERAVLDSFYFGYLPDVDDAAKLNKTHLQNLSRYYPLTVQKKTRALL
ncbi:MAG: hypothetical protein AUJ71_03215 [Candidatus Omnitrophica bacterium CG1_02_49_16]|nr:MAG: hypothetical protein AUJ71_03215 [Candidatus Omnitrophica bacterium CG1_02_49_16]